MCLFIYTRISKPLVFVYSCISNLMVYVRCTDAPEMYSYHCRQTAYGFYYLGFRGSKRLVIKELGSKIRSSSGLWALIPQYWCIWTPGVGWLWTLMMIAVLQGKNLPFSDVDVAFVGHPVSDDLNTHVLYIYISVSLNLYLQVSISMSISNIHV